MRRQVNKRALVLYIRFSVYASSNEGSCAVLIGPSVVGGLSSTHLEVETRKLEPLQRASYTRDVLAGIMAFSYAFEDGGRNSMLHSISSCSCADIVFLHLSSSRQGPRLIYEYRLTVLVGECSYPLHVMQYNVVCFWFRTIYSDTKQGPNDPA
jgi:hypothetical protein